jgi:hypothetical protein
VASACASCRSGALRHGSTVSTYTAGSAPQSAWYRLAHVPRGVGSSSLSPVETSAMADSSCAPTCGSSRSAR